jgi:predicted nucleic-acid-binding Zn-ribbon protein
MKDGKCPMCNSSEVYANKSVNFTASGADTINVDDGETEEMVVFNPHICKNCGFTAWYAEDMDVIKDLLSHKGWKKTE